MIPIQECKNRSIYLLQSRNLSVGVYDSSKRCFIGIRYKFGYRIDSEYHWDCGPPFGTAKPLEEVGVLPDEISLLESFGTEDDTTKRRVAFDRPIADGGVGWYFLDSNEPSENILPVRINNSELFKYMKALDERFSE